MAEEIDRGSSDRQATWVALKTLRQRPTVVGRTDDGATVYEIRSVRLVLPPGASHFKRLVPCAKCGREVPGSPILSVFDLDRPANSVFCDRCAKSSHAPAPGPPPAAPPVVRTGAVEGRRPAPVEPQMAEVRPRMPAPVENAGELQRLSEQVADLLRAQNAELAKVSASVAEVRAGMSELRELNRALARGQRDLGQRIMELESRPGAEIETTSARELSDVRANLAALRAEIAGIEARIGDESAPFTARLEMQRTELTQALHDVAQETLMSVAEPLRDLAKARDDFERRLETLQRKAEEGEQHMKALTASADAGASRQHALEQRIDATAQQIARQIEVQTRPAPAPPVPGGIMESLERQLRAAEERLLRTTGDAGGE